MHAGIFIASCVLTVSVLAFLGEITRARWHSQRYYARRVGYSR